jgi:hypothetical protein
MLRAHSCLLEESKYVLPSLVRLFYEALWQVAIGSQTRGSRESQQTAGARRLTESLYFPM